MSISENPAAVTTGGDGLYSIFYRIGQEDAVWLQDAETEEGAYEMLRHASAQKPGEFILFHGSVVIATATQGIIETRHSR